MSDWISITDKLPDNDQSVYIAYKNYPNNEPWISICHYIGDDWYVHYDIESIRGAEYYDYKSKITHWKPTLMKYPNGY
jgi:hypothetical protein